MRGDGNAPTHNVRAARLSAVVSPAIDLAVQGSLIVVIVVGLSRVSSGAMTVGELVAFLLYVNCLAAPMSGLFDIAPALQTGLAALERTQEVLDLPVETEHEGRAATARAAPGQGLVLRNLRFRYTDREILRGTSFQVPRNSCTAVAGASGAGKSTLFSLLGRFYEPGGGSIAFDGRDVPTEHSITEWRARIGLVEQHSPLMYGTLRDNITYAAPDADEMWLRQVVEMAGLTALVNRLPSGLDTEVGEHGSSLQVLASGSYDDVRDQLPMHQVNA